MAHDSANAKFRKYRDETDYNVQYMKEYYMKTGVKCILETPAAFH